MNERIAVQPHRGNEPPRREDACRVGILRRIAAARLRHCGLEALTDEVSMIVSELLTNAALHSGTTEIALSLRVRDGFLHVTVTDGMPGGAKRKSAGDDAESGRGLALAHQAATVLGQPEALAPTASLWRGDQGPRQRIDRMYATPRIAEALVRLEVIATEEVIEASDHALVMATFSFDTLRRALSRTPWEKAAAA
jgi:anti-sigma regulatory factor (Ser/Thr protein kinase)